MIKKEDEQKRNNKETMMNQPNRQRPKRRRMESRMMINKPNDELSRIPKRRLGPKPEPQRNEQERNGPKKEIKGNKSHGMPAVIDYIRKELKAIKNVGDGKWKSFKKNGNERALMKNILREIDIRFNGNGQAWNGYGSYLNLGKILVIFPKKVLCDSFHEMVGNMIGGKIEFISMYPFYPSPSSLRRANIISTCPGRLNKILKKNEKEVAVLEGLDLVIMWDHPILNKFPEFYELDKIKEHLFKKDNGGPELICVGE